ncbi:MAG: hypothetical protein WC604_04295, partial [Candidatus Gracilibacteria bacterium]
ALQFANPKLDLSEITVFEDKLVFDEKNDNGGCGGGGVWPVLTFPYNDEDALRILTNNRAKKIRVIPVDVLSDSRLRNVIKMLEQAGIKITIGKGRKVS